MSVVGAAGAAVENTCFQMHGWGGVVRHQLNLVSVVTTPFAVNLRKWGLHVAAKLVHHNV